MTLTHHQFRAIAIESQQRLRALHGPGASADRAHLEEMLRVDGLHPMLRQRIQFALSRHDMAERREAHERASSKER